MTDNDPTSLLVPRVREGTPGTGHWEVPDRLRVSGPREWVDALTDLLSGGTGWRFGDSEGDPHVVLRRAALPAEGYRLEVTSAGIRIEAGDRSGLVHACSTLRALLPDWTELPAPPAGRVTRLPLCSIVDEPRFAWRGIHVDVARHFVPLEWLFAFVDRISRFKLNRLHLHLTDDQGWRFEVKSMPRLTEVGAWRPGTGNPGREDGTPHGGYYTQAQLRALVEHARSRGIVVVPEVDVPGHVRALLAAHPELGNGTEVTVATGFDVFTEVLHPRERSVAAVKQIFSELLEVFDSPWIHIGGDECPRKQWRESVEMQELAASLGLEDGVESLQRWFTAELQGWLAERGRTTIAWDEVLQSGPVPGAVVMAWRGARFGREALAQGNEVIMSPNQTTYFDHYQSDLPTEPHGQPETCTWQDVVAWDPCEGIEDDANLLGVQGQLWTEYMPDTSHLEYMAFPRLLVLADIAWAGRIDDPCGYRAVLEAAVARLEAAGVNVRPLDGPRPWQEGGTGLRRRPD